MENNNQNERNTRNAVLLYWVGTIGQMAIVSACVFLLKLNNISYPKIVSVTVLIIGGMSSALWGIIVSLKYGLKKSLFQIIKDFFNLKQSPWAYLLVVGFILIIFWFPLFQGRVNPNTYWYTYVVLFLQAIVFGGIEEIGWRYTWQPLIEKKHSFIVASLSTFISWALWHYMYFYITDSITMISHVPFLIGLLGSCFILGAIFKKTNSLWLCVLYHCLLNVFSQTLQAESFVISTVCTSVGIIISIILVNKVRFKF